MPAPFDDDAQRRLEQHALRNVRALAEKLGTQDHLERRHEKKLVIGVGIFAVALIGYFVARVMTAESAADVEARRRCELDVQVKEGWRLKDQLVAEHPGMDAMEVSRRVNERYAQMKEVAEKACAKK
jgi:hypothetical protein